MGDVNNYMPGDDMVRTRYAAGLSALEADYDRWLAERDRKVAERTWDEAVYHLEAVIGSEMRRRALADNPYRCEASS